MEVKLSSGHTVKFKPFVDRRTARTYRQTLLKNATIRTVEQKNEKGVVEKVEKYVYSPDQFDAACDVLVRGVVDSVVNSDGNPIVATDDFFENMDGEDFDKLLLPANAMFYKNESEKKSSSAESKKA